MIGSSNGMKNPPLIKIQTLEMEDTTSQSTSDRYASVKKGSWFNQFRHGSNPWMARYVYTFMFLLANLLAWAMRDYGTIVLGQLKTLKYCDGGQDCLGTEGVLRVSMGCFIFYFMMSVSTAGTTKSKDRRETWHSDLWFSKILMMVGLILLPFFVPPEIIEAYGNFAHFGAGVFLLFQLISIISFITWLNDFCHSEEYADKFRFLAMIVASTAYIGCILAMILLYIWNTLESPIALNIFLILSTAILIHLMTIISLRTEVNAGFLTSSLMGLYVVFLCWSAMRSEKAGADSNGNTLTIISFALAVPAIVFATFSTGIDSKSFQLRKKQEEEIDDDVPYGYGFFHFVFATGAMYFAMLLVGWNAKHSAKKFTIDIGSASTWVRMVNEWLAAGVYIWRIVAPAIRKAKLQANESQV